MADYSGKEKTMSVHASSVFISVVVWAAATCLAAGADARLVHEAIVDAPVDDVWAAFTTKAGQESWNVAHAEIDLQVGGKMLTHYDAKGAIGDPNTIENTILSFDAPRMISIRATKPPEKFPFKEALKKMWTVVYFERAGERQTKVTVVSQGFGDDEDSKTMRGHFDAGNAFTLKQLQKRFAPKEPAGTAKP